MFWQADSGRISDACFRMPSTMLRRQRIGPSSVESAVCQHRCRVELPRPRRTNNRTGRAWRSRRTALHHAGASSAGSSSRGDGSGHHRPQRRSAMAERTSLQQFGYVPCSQSVPYQSDQARVFSLVAQLEVGLRTLNNNIFSVRRELSSVSHHWVAAGHDAN